MSKEKAISNNMVALARRRGRRGGNARSQMLRMIMPMLSREQGDKLADAIKNKSPQKFRIIWNRIRDQLEDKLAVEASDNPFEGMSADEVYHSLIAQIVKDFGGNEEETVVVASADNTRLITGNAKIPKNTRALVANGMIELENEQGEEFYVRINDVVVPSNPSITKNPQMKVEAEIYKKGEKSRLHQIEFKGEYAAACSEIVINAMSLIEEQG